ncbi:kelch-like protein 26 isoform 3-T3 [Dugong dugon]
MAESGGSGGAGGGGFGAGSGSERTSSMADKNGALKCTFSAPGHSAGLLQGLAALRAQGQLLDVALTVNTEVFHAHKVVLAACSDYFRAMFTGGMRETGQAVVELKGVSARGLRHIVDFAYSAESNRLQSCAEIDLFHAAVRWLQYDPARRPRASQVLGHVRFPLMQPSELVDSVQTLDLMVEDALCRRYLLEAFNYQVLPFRQHEMQSPRTAVRSDVPSLLTFGGTPYTDHDRAVSAKVYLLPEPGARQFRELAEMEVGCSHTCVAVLDNFVYVAGGQHLQYRSGEGAVDACYRYDPHLNQWLRLQAMQESRIQFQLNVLGGLVYATGGRNRAGSLASVERYCPRRNEWGYACSLKRRTWGHAGAVAGSRLYVSGGYGISVEDKKALHCYDPVADQWEVRAPMSEPRVLHAMVGAGGRLYALGGRMDHVDRCFDVLAVEYYVPEADQWTSVSPMRAGQSEAGCCLLERKIYVVGGYSWRLNNVTGLVQVYNTETDEWERDLHFPESFAGVACAPVLLPRTVATRRLQGAGGLPRGVVAAICLPAATSSHRGHSLMDAQMSKPKSMVYRPLAPTMPQKVLVCMFLK